MLGAAFAAGVIGGKLIGQASPQKKQ